MTYYSTEERLTMSFEKEIIEGRKGQKIEIRGREVKEIIIRNCNKTRIFISDNNNLESVHIKNSYLRNLTLALSKSEIKIENTKIKDAFIVIENKKNP